MKIRLLLALLLLAGAAACQSATEPSPREQARPGGVSAAVQPADTAKVDGGIGMGSGN